MSETPAVPVTPAAAALAEAQGVDLSQIQGTGDGGKITKADVEAFLPPNATEAAIAHAAEVGVDLRKLKGSGTDGKITKADVEAATATVEADAAKAGGSWYYSLDPKHVAPDLIDDRRFFRWTAPADNPAACPEENGKQVSAVPVPAKGEYPTSILEVAARLAQK